MSWLRMLTISSFKYHNPDWEIRLHGTPESIRKHGLEYTAQEGDWLRWQLLEFNGGFSVASDIVFVRPIPDEWLDCGLNGCTNGSGRIWQMAMVGATPGHPFMGAALDRISDILDKGNPTGYQDFGPNLLQAMGRNLLWSEGPFFDQPMDALCFYRHTDIEGMWNEKQMDLPERVIGVHWYGAHPLSKLAEYMDLPGGDSWVSELVKS